MAQTAHSFATGADLFPALPEGFQYRDALLAPDEERALVAAVEPLPFQPFDFHGYLGKREVVSFGWRYDYGGRALRRADALPSFLLPLRQVVANFAGIAADEFQQILVTRYDAGAGIGWHRDKPMFEDLVAVSLLAPCTLRFRRRDGAGWERATQEARPRSAYLLRGSARAEWEHSVPPVEARRYSITFRNFIPDFAPST